MAECQCNITNGLLSPGVFNLKQFLNETTEMRWTVSSHQLPGGIDLANYDAFLVMQRGNSGEIDEVMLSKAVNTDGTITLVWNVGKWATWLKGYVKYQIVFRGTVVSELSVLGAADENANGVYKINSELVDGNFRIWTHEKNDAYKIDYDIVNSRWRIRNGANIVSYQTVPHDEPHYGLWDNLYVGNAVSLSWRSLEAAMYISESIAADEQVTAKHPTILRQMWQGMRDMIIKSGFFVFESEITADQWEGISAPYYVNAMDIVDVPNGCTVTAVRLFKDLEIGGFGDIANIRYEQNANGGIWVYCLEKITGKLAVTVKGGNDYVIVPKNALDGGNVTSVNGQTGAVTLSADDIGAASNKDVEQLQTQMNEISGSVASAVAELEGI